MKKQFIEDLPLYLNSVSVSLLAFETDLSTIGRFCLFIIAGLTFVWYSDNMEKKYKL